MSYLETTARTYVNKYNINISDKKEIKRLLFILNKIPCLYRKKRKMLINRLLYKSKIIKKYCIVKKCNKELLNLIKTNIRWSYHILKRKIKKPILKYQRRFIKKTIKKPLSKLTKAMYIILLL